MEDEDSKIRRNLMAVSTLIVLAWWLQAPLDKISEKLLGLTDVAPNFQWRAWLAALLALAYFCLRFRFSTEHGDDRRLLGVERIAVQIRLIERWLSWETSWYARWGTTPPVLGDGFSAVAGPYKDAVRKITGITVANVSIGRQDEMGQVLPPPPNQVFGMASFVVKRLHHTGGMEQTTLNSIGFDLSGFQRRVLAVWSGLWLLIYSRASTSLFVPWSLAAAAAVVCAVQQFKTWPL